MKQEADKTMFKKLKISDCRFGVIESISKYAIVFLAVVLGTLYCVQIRQGRSGNSQVIVQATEFDFGKVQPGTELQHLFTVGNRGAQRLVLNLDECGCGEDSSGHVILLPGDQTQIPVSMTVQDHADNQTKSLMVTTSDPDKPRIEFRIRAQAIL